MIFRTALAAAALLIATSLGACNNPNAKKAGDDLQSAAANAGDAIQEETSDAMAAAADAADRAGDAVANATDNSQQAAANATDNADQAMNADDLAAAGDTSRKPAGDAPAPAPQ